MIDEQQLHGWRVNLKLAILLGYFTLVLLAAWPTPLRPSALDGAHAAANRVLWLASLTPGHKVFAIPEHVEWKTVADCFHIRSFDAQGTAQDLWPPKGRCVRDGIHLRVSPVAVYLSRTLNGAGTILGEPGAEVDHGYMFSAIGRAFCDRARRAAPPPATVDLLWVRDVRSYQEGTQREERMLYFSWACEDERFLRVQWFPDPDRVRAFWRTGT